LSVAETFDVTVAPINDAPIIATPIADVAVDEDAADQVIDLAAIFTDVDDATLTYAVTANTNAGLVTTALAGASLTLGFLADQSGAASITVTATDGEGLSVAETFDVTVAPINDAPVITTVQDSYEVVEGTDLPILTVAAEDVDGDTLIFSLEGADESLFDIDGASGMVTFKETPDFDEADDNVFEFTVVASDGALQSELAVTVALLKDSDGDFVPDGIDNATFVSNPLQQDTDEDGIGNIVDADFDNDGFVKLEDFIVFRSTFGTSEGDSAFNPDADFNSDGDIELTDFSFFRALFGLESSSDFMFPDLGA
ncbi:MAG: Ig-like domain-containing protein, partial [Rhodospirillaceae bacterium]